MVRFLKIILISFVLFFPFSVFAYSQKDIIYSDIYSKIECDDLKYEEVTASTTPGFVCHSYVTNEYVKVGYKGRMSEIASNEILNERTSKTRTFDLGNGRVKKRIYLNDQYINSGNTWYDIEEDELTIDEYNNLTNQSFSFIKSATAQVATTTVGDGYITNKWGAWSTIHDASSGSSVDYSGTSIAVIAKHDTGQGGYRIDAGYLPFDNIPQGGNIESVSLFLFVTAVAIGDSDPDAFIVIASSTVTDKTQLTTADFNDRKFIALSNEVDLYDLSDDNYNEFVLNSTGIDNLSTTTFFTVLEGHDYNDNPVQDNTNNQVNFASGEVSGSTHDPYLEITYISTSSINILPTPGFLFLTASSSAGEVINYYFSIDFFLFVSITIAFFLIIILVPLFYKYFKNI